MGEADTFDATPVYARRPVRKGGVPKAALIAVPVVLALGIGAWALTAGESSRDGVAIEDANSLTTSRLSSAPAPISPEVTAPAAIEATPAAASTVATRVATPAATSAPRATSTSPSRRAAPARRASAGVAHTTPAPSMPDTPQPYSPGGLQTVITDPGPVAAPPSIAPTPTLPVEITPPVTPPASATPPGGGA
jgi:hypothetical protein